MTDTHTNVLVRMTNSMKLELTKCAKSKGTSLTAEITDRLRTSLSAHGHTLQAILARETSPAAGIAPAPINTKHPDPAYTLSDIDRAMLAVFRAMPPEKQLALLSLFN